MAAFASWHENHEPARRALDGGLRLVEHCALETYSVLTRLLPPHRAATAAACGADLVTCDRCAFPVYECYGVQAELLK